jgi:hypothetical protein
MEHPSQAPSGRTFMCAVVFVDIVEYSKKPVSEQVGMKTRFNAIVSHALEHTPASERIIVDTGDGAALCFLGDPEDALFAANNLRDMIAAAPDASELTVRIGINLGPVKVVRDINGQPNIIGDGINVAQRVMTFAKPNQVLVSRSYFEVVSRLTQEYSQLFRFVGMRSDKHVREHELYEVAVSDPVHGVPLSQEERRAVMEPDAGMAPRPASPRAAEREGAQPPRKSPALLLGVAGALVLFVGISAGLWLGRGESEPQIQPAASPPQPPAEATRSTQQAQQAPPQKPVAQDPDGAHRAAPTSIPSAPEQTADRSSSPPPQPQVQSAPDIVVNGRTLTPQEIQQLRATYGSVAPPGHYWYDPASGLYGIWGREAAGFMHPGHNFGPLSAEASRGNTGVFINGRQINMAEAIEWQRLFGTVNRGRYWLDGRTGNLGVEGNPMPVANLVQAVRLAQQRQGGGGSTSWSSNYASGGSGGGCTWVNVPGSGSVSSGC